MEGEAALRDGAPVEADVCIIGAGPAGLAIASALAATGRSIVLIESGGEAEDPDAEALNDGDVTGDAYAGLRATRHRQLGGTAAIWNTRTPGGIGAKFAPLDPIDFEARNDVALSGWPFSFTDVRPWYDRANTACGLGPFDYESARWSAPGREPVTEDEGAIESRIYRFGARDAVLGPMLRAVRGASNVRILRRSTAVELVPDFARRRVERVRIASGGQARWVVARHVVLCAGAIENARLLLCTGAGRNALGNGSGWVGRCFMEHPRDSTLLLLPSSASSYDRLRFYDVFTSAGGAAACGRLAISEVVSRKAGLLNASATLLPVVRREVGVARKALGRFARHAERWLPRGGHGWSTHPWPARVLRGFRVLVNLEQAPDPENRVVLGSAADALGIPRATLHWRWRQRDEDSRREVRALYGRALERAGLGVVRQVDAPLDPNAHHHAGTTRMHVDAQYGVVDPDCRVHGTENLWVGGASVFPTAGFANPALTIIALALRLADRLATE